MQKTVNLLFALLLSTALMACGHDKKEPATYSYNEIHADAENLDAAEKSLASFGLKFQNDFSTNTMKWDKDFLTNYVAANPSVKAQDAIAPLERYVSVANAFSQKYAGSFNIKKEDGSVSPMEVTDTARSTLEAKISVANQTIEKFKTLSP